MATLLHKFKRWPRNVAAHTFRAGLNAWWFIMSRLPRPTHKRLVLLHTYNDLMTEYLRQVADLIRDDPRIEVSLTAPLGHSHAGTPGRELAKKAQVAYVPYIKARASQWDLILFASNGLTHAYQPRIPRVLINHSLTGGKIIAGQNTRYGKGNTMTHGRPTFTRMFEASETVRQRAIEQNPSLEDVIAVIGDLRTDRMLSNVQEQDTIRNEYGIAANKPVVLIQSTWGEASLMEAYGHQILPAAKKLAEAGQYHVLISIHPNLWGNSPHALRQPWGSRAIEYETDGLTVLRPGSNWERFMVMADVAITDHTANAAAFAMLRRPMLFVTIPDDVVLPDSIERQLYELCPRLDVGALDRMGTGIQRAIDQYSRDSLEELIPTIDSCPGEAETRILEQLYAVLDMTQSQEMVGHANSSR